MGDVKKIDLAYGETVPFEVTLKRDNVGVDLSGATVTFSMVWHGEPHGVSTGPEQPTTWTPGATVAIEGFTSTPDADQTANKGKTAVTPTTAFYTAAPPGLYRPQWKVVFADTSVQKFPRDIRSGEYLLVIYPSVDGLNDA